jgi:secreted PhoX family phosphatase
VVVNKDGRVVAYSGDDAQLDYVYRFVSRDRIRPGDRAYNMRLLSEGTLAVARYDEDGTVT